MIIIKPHHFMDIIKLYGAGIECFVPDKAFEHDFYKVANEIANHLDCELMLTIEGDDICRPCNRFDGKVCTDPLVGIVEGYDKKDVYNKAIDERIINQLKLDVNKSYTAKDLLQRIGSDRDIIFHVWKEEAPAFTSKRNDLFRKGFSKLMEQI